MTNGEPQWRLEFDDPHDPTHGRFVARDGREIVFSSRLGLLAAIDRIAADCDQQGDQP